MAGKKTGKRLLTWVLVLVMALSLPPLNALADESQATVFTDAEEAQNATGVKASKKRSEPDSYGNYTITLSVEGTTTTSETTNNLPADVVLVVDTSGSMAFCSQAEHKHDDDACYAKCTRDNHPEHWDPLFGISYHIDGTDCIHFPLDGYYYLTCKKTEHEHWAGKTWGSFTGDGCGNYEDDKWTEKKTDDRRITHAIAAAKQFVGGLLTDGSKINVGLVGFSGSATVSRALTQNKDQLNDAIGSLTTAYSTGTNYAAGLNAAEDILNKGSNEQQFIVFISDGEPEEGKDGKAAAEALKDSGVTIMTVGIALSDNEASALKAISSTDSKGNVLYYATSATGLSSILATLRQTITDSIHAGTGAVMTDIINTDDFELVSKDNDLTENNGTLTWRIGDIGKDKREVSFKVKLKDGVQKVGELYTNKDVSLTFKSSKLENKEVKFTKDAIGTPFVEIYSVTYTDGVDDAVVFEDQTTYGLAKGAKTPGFSGETPTRKDYTFDGWSPKVADTVGDNTYKIVYTAQWKGIQKYSVTYELDATSATPLSAGNLPTDSNKYSSGDTYQINSTYGNTAIDEGGYTYTFSGWKLNGAGPVLTGDQTMGNESVVLKGTWTKTPNKYSLSYNTNGGTISENANYTTKAGEVAFGIKLDTPKAADMTKEGYTFAGWYSDEDLNTPAPDTMPAKDLTLYAKWEKNTIPTYTFDLSNQNTIKVNKEFKSKYGRSAEKSFTATATIEKQETYIIVNPGIDNNVTNNGSAVPTKPDYTKVGEATGTVTLKTDTTKAFDFGKDSNGKDSKFQLEPGDYRITVEETKGTDRYVTYDNARYTYTFTVTNEGKIVNINTPITCTFTNMYTKRHTAATPSKPTLNTGDHYAYVMGYPDGTVRPNGSITRAEVSAILFRLLSDKTRDEYFTTESSFTDVKAGAWYNNSIATLEKAGVIVDTAKGGAFRPNEAITRAELAAMLAQFSDAKPVKGVKFSDVSAEHWAYEAIAIAAKMGWIEGYPDGTFRPDATITRAEMMTLVNRALERVPSDEDHLLSKRVMLTFPDCKSGDWFYIAVQEATNSHTYERAATEKNGDEQWTALRANRDWTLLEK